MNTAGWSLFIFGGAWMAYILVVVSLLRYSRNLSIMLAAGTVTMIVWIAVTFWVSPIPLELQ